LNFLPLEPAISVQTPNKQNTAINLRTDGAKFPYEDSQGVIQVNIAGKPPAWIKVNGFRTVDAKWINERLLFINLGIGRVAAVHAIYDTHAKQWLYQDSLSYVP